MNRLKRREAEFVEELERLNGENAEEAVVRAGLAPAGKKAAAAAKKLLLNDSVMEYMRERAALRLRASGYTPERICLELIKVYERCMQAEPVTKKGAEGDNVCGEYKFDARGAMKALELLGQSLGVFRPEVRVSADEGLKVEIEVVGS